MHIIRMRSIYVPQYTYIVQCIHTYIYIHLEHQFVMYDGIRNKNTKYKLFNIFSYYRYVPL